MKALAIVGLLAGSAAAAPPKILLDAELKAAWKKQAGEKKGPVPGSIALCTEAAASREHEKAVYMGGEWSRVLQACLVAYAATDKPDFAKTGVRFMTALLDDLETIGDGKGGDLAARRDSGYAIRNLGPYTALAYMWLFDQLPADVKDRAPKRWKAWLDWFQEKGYRARQPGSNYQAGYLLTATLAGIATGDAAFAKDELWGKDMAKAFAPHGMLDGGDWPEGWQYGPLSVAEYALALRAAKAAGWKVPDAGTWLHQVLQRFVHGLSPADGVYPSGDAEDAPPNLKPHVLTLDAIALGDASPEDKKWARGELNRLQLADKDYWLYDALAYADPTHVAIPRETWPLYYETYGNGQIYLRTRWADDAIWFVAQCSHSLDMDHRHPDTGNFVLSRGKDDVVVDPSPYGSQSTLTSNAPTVLSPHMPEDYKPSQGFWGKKSGWDYKVQTKGGLLAARCDYSDQFMREDQKSDVPEALRDFVLVPSADGKNAALVVIDRATAGKMLLTFHVPGAMAADGSATVGASQLKIAPIGNAGAHAIVRPDAKDCFKGQKRGSCDAGRFDSSGYRVTLDGPNPRAVHVLSVTGSGSGAPFTATKLDHGVAIGGPRAATIAWPDKPNEPFVYTAPPGEHIVLDVKDAVISAKAVGGNCEVSVAHGGTYPRPAAFTLDAQCKVNGEVAAPAGGAMPQRVTHPPRSGCCSATTPPASTAATALPVVALFVRRRRRRARAHARSHAS